VNKKSRRWFIGGFLLEESSRIEHIERKKENENSVHLLVFIPVIDAFFAANF
jgi:hypothetical protein